MPPCLLSALPDGGNPDRGRRGFGHSGPPPIRGPAFPVSGMGAPRGLRLRPRLSRGFSRPGPTATPGRPIPGSGRSRNVSRKPIDRSRKTIRSPTCQTAGLGLLFRPRRRGDPETSTGAAGNRRAGRTGEPACRKEGQPEAGGKPQAEGNGRRPDGDPSGSSSGRRPRRVARPATADREVGHRCTERTPEARL